MEAAMNKGDVAMMISGPWAWANLKKAKIDFGVAPIPSIGGKPLEVVHRRAGRDDQQGEHQQAARGRVHRELHADASTGSRRWTPMSRSA